MEFVIENSVLKSTVEPENIDRKLGPMIWDAFNKNPNHVGQIDAETGEQTTFEEMKDHSIRCALWLKKLGIKPNDIVVACTHNHLNTYVPLVATFFIDAIFNSWNHIIEIDRARYYVKLFSPKVIFACESAANVLVEASKLENLNVQIVVFGKHSSLPTLLDIMNGQTQEEINSFTVVNAKSSKEPALIWMTSGSTGIPKGVIKSTRSLLATLQQIHNFADTTPQRFLWHSPLHWTSCIQLMFLNILRQQIRIIPAYYEVENALQIIQKYKVNRVFFALDLISYVVRSSFKQKYDLTSLNLIIIGGSKYSKCILEELQQKIPSAFIHYVYATTETGHVCFTTRASKHVGSVGFVLASVQAKFVDLRTGESLGPNQRGEIRVKSEAMMIEYHNNPKATKDAFDKNGWYHTGDIGYYNETGEIVIVDRNSEMIKYKNYFISPAEIEEILLSHSDIIEAVVVALPHKLDGNWPTAFCKKIPKSNLTEDHLMKLTSVLEDYQKLRGGIHFVDNFSYLASGKIARHEMRRLAEQLIAIDKMNLG